MIMHLKSKKNHQLSPGDFIFSRGTLIWAFKPLYIRKQFPFIYKIFALYCFLYFKLTKNKTLQNGAYIFRLFANLYSFLKTEKFLDLQLNNYQVYLVPTDPRLFLCIQELASGNSDTKILTSFLNKGDTFIDIGANYGSYSILASRMVGAEGFVLSIEPQPHLAKAVEKSLIANSDCHFEVHQIAVGNRSDEIDLLIPYDSSGYAGIYAEHSGTYKHQKIQVPMKRFDETFNWQKFPGKVFVKLDIEGSEYACLQGAKNMIQARQPNIIIEIHPDTLRASGHSGEELKQLLLELGYHQYIELNCIEKKYELEDLKTDVQRNIMVL